MLKIKFNINEFIIIFSEKIWKKKWMQKNLLQPLPASASPFCFSAPFSSSLFFLGQRAVSPFFFLALTFLFLLMCCPFSTQVLSPKRFSVQPNTFLFFFLFCSVFSSPFLFQFSASFCCFCSACLSLVFSASLLLFCRHVALLSSAFYFFSPKPFWAQNTFSVQPKNLSLFVVQRLLLFVSFLPAFLFCL